MHPNNELPSNILSLRRRRFFGSGAVDALRRRWLKCALAVLLFTLGVCVPPANAQDQLETAYVAVRPSLVFVENYHAGRLSATGTGFVVGHRDGHMLIVTNRHVVEGGDSFRGVIQFPTTVSFGLTVFAVGTSDDLALLESTERDAPALSLATTLPALGHAVSIAGYPHTQIVIAFAGGGLSPSVHAGNVNALPENGYYIQYDAQTDHGNSGGPLFDLDSAMVYGIVVLKMGTIETNFAISAIRIRTFLANAGVFPSTLPLVVEGVATIATPAPTAAPPGSIDRASCASAMRDFLQIDKANTENFDRYTEAMHAATKSLHAATSGEFVGVSALLGVELRAIQAIIHDDEPKLFGPRDRVAKSGAVATAQALVTLTTDAATRDQTALQFSLERNYLIGVLINGGTPDKLVGNLGQVTDRMTEQYLHDFDDLANLGICTR
jgi:hypothetical protein